ncbi:MAG: Calx-beta domain-containing protein, partial [Methylovulum sp.]|nr:Calx-beta domain-containing protein [Methylovulum sp.]
MATKITITPGNDKIKGTSSADFFDALAGNDTVFGLGGNDTLIGNTGDDSLIGGVGNDNLQGNEGKDTLDGGIGADVLIGGAGDDVYFVDNVRDKIVEDNTSGGGVDKVNSSVSYSLADKNDKQGVEDLMLTGKQNLSATGNDKGNLLVGNDGNNVLQGNGGNDKLSGGLGDDSLNGGLGTDKLEGGAGSDTYLINSNEDSIIESAIAPEQDTDTVQSSITYTLPDNVEALTLTGILDIDGTGNSARNRIDGNDGANQLSGAEFDDTLNGNGGDDILDGGTHNDTLNGGEGNDTAAYDGVDANYSVVFNKGSNTWTVVDKNTGDTDVLSDIETLQFADTERDITSSTIPSLSVNNVTLTEGNSGTKNAVFTLTLSEAAAQAVSIDYATLDDTAEAGQDYTASSGTVSFAAGETRKTISVPIIGDKAVEINETLRLALSNPNGITLNDSEAVATLTNDDQPLLSITGTALSEGNTGSSNATVTVNLSAAFDKTVTVDYATMDS